jgi:hypothetical protein
MIAVKQIGSPSRIISGRNDRIEVELFEGGVDSVNSSVLINIERLIVGDSEGWIDHVRIEGDRFRKLEDVLVEERHFDVGMRIVEIDRALKITARHRHSDTRLEVIGDVAFEIVEKNKKFGIARVREGKSPGVEINYGSAGALCSKSVLFRTDRAVRQRM